MRDAIDLLGDTLSPGNNLTIVGDDAAAPIVRADRTSLTQILTNLLTNAAEALPSGAQINVAVYTVSISHSMAKSLSLSVGLYCRLTVEDNGTGIPAAEISKIFDPFFTTKPQGKGTGLGLSVVAGLAQSWGGTATVDSTEGMGTCFTIYLPVAEKHLQAAQ